jgi:hypothetical protein
MIGLLVSILMGAQALVLYTATGSALPPLAAILAFVGTAFVLRLPC